MAGALRRVQVCVADWEALPTGLRGRGRLCTTIWLTSPPQLDLSRLSLSVRLLGFEGGRATFPKRMCDPEDVREEGHIELRRMCPLVSWKLVTWAYRRPWGNENSGFCESPEIQAPGECIRSL